MFEIENATVRIIRGDITEMSTDAIVNAANSSLMGGGGVDGAIHRKGGPVILEECKRIRTELWPHGLPTGKAVMTSGGNLKAKHVIHTVGPIWHGGNRGEAESLREAYTNSLKSATMNRLRSISFPSISAGTYGYPVQEASRVALKAIRAFLETEDKISEVTLVLFSEDDLKIYLEVAREEFGKSKTHSKDNHIVYKDS